MRTLHNAIGLTILLIAAPVTARDQPDGLVPAPPAPPPLRMVIPPPRPPLRVTPPAPPASMALDVQVYGGTEKLFDRTLTVRGGGGAQANIEVIEAPACQSAKDEYAYDTERTGLRVNLRSNRRGDEISVDTTWTRRAPDCAVAGTLTTGINASVALAPGLTRELRGDGGLRVVLRRQR